MTVPTLQGPWEAQSSVIGAGVLTVVVIINEDN